VATSHFVQSGVATWNHELHTTYPTCSLLVIRSNSGSHALKTLTPTITIKSGKRHETYSKAQNPSILKDKLRKVTEEMNPTCHSTKEGWMGKAHALPTLMHGAMFCSFK
jgi:hypothetical protein